MEAPLHETALDRLRADVTLATDESVRELAMARLAVALAQEGNTAEAAAIASQLRGKSHRSRSNTVSIYLLLLDGILGYYTTRDPSCLDRINRAQNLAIAIGDARVAADASVWLAHVAYNFDKLEILDRALRNATRGFELIDDSLRARLTGMIADLKQLVGCWEDARKWYGFAREFSRRAHDRAALVAVEYNRLAVGLTRARYEVMLELDRNNERSRGWAVEYESVKSLHVGFQNRSLYELLTLCEAWARYLERDYGATLTLLEQLRDRSAWTLVGQTERALTAEIVYCQALLGSVAEALIDTLPSLESLVDRTAPDRLDCLYYLHSISKIHRLDVDLILLREQLAEARGDLRDQLDQLSEIVGSMNEFENEVRRRVHQDDL